MAAAVRPFDSIHRRFHPRVLRYLAGIAGPEEAADLAQVTMIKVSEHLAGFRGESSLSTWIYRIATNVALDRLRQRAPDVVPIDTEPEGDEALPPQLQGPSAEDSAARGEMNACLREFIHRLPVNYRTVLVLGDIEGFTSREIAQITGSSVEAVKIRLHRARLRLREDLTAGCRVERDERSELACERRPAPAK